MRVFLIFGVLFALAWGAHRWSRNSFEGVQGLEHVDGVPGEVDAQPLRIDPLEEPTRTTSEALHANSQPEDRFLTSGRSHEGMIVSGLFEEETEQGGVLECQPRGWEGGGAENELDWFLMSGSYLVRKGTLPNGDPWRVENLAPGKYRVLARTLMTPRLYSHFHEVELKNSAGLTKIDVPLEPGRTVRGKVWDEEGSPIEYFSIVNSVEPIPRKGLFPWSIEEDGSFEAPLSLMDEVDLKFLAGGYFTEHYRKRWSEFPGDWVDVVLRKRYLAGGQIHFPLGVPQREVEVLVFTIEGSATRMSQMTSRKSGKFSLEVGRHNKGMVYARGGGSHKHDYSVLWEFNQGDSLGEIDLWMSKSASCQARIVDTESQPVARTSVKMIAVDHPGIVRQATTDAQGAVTIRGLCATRYRVEIDGDEWGIPQILVNPGETLRGIEWVID